MAEKASAPGKTETAKSNAKNRLSRGDSVMCEVCGLSVVVEEVGGVAVSKETILFCCGKPMKERKAPPKIRAAKPAKAAKTLSGEPLTQAAGASGLVPDPNEDVTQQ